MSGCKKFMSGSSSGPGREHLFREGAMQRVKKFELAIAEEGKERAVNGE